MRIEEISMSNWLSFPDHWVADGQRQVPTLTFLNDPIYLIYGRNGSGKSSVMDAIVFALFGDYSRRERANGKAIQEIETKSAIRDGEKNAQVKLTFSYNGQRHRIIRWLGMTKSSYELWDETKRDWVLQTSTGKVITSRIEKMLGMDSNLFRATVMLEQGRTSRFMEMDASEQITHVTQLIGLQGYDAYYEKAKKLASERKGKRDKLEEELEELKAVTPERIEGLTDQQKKLDDTLTELTKDKEELTTLAEQVGRISKLKRDIEEIDNKITLDEKKLERAGEIRAAAKLVNGWMRVEPQLESLRGANSRSAKAVEDTKRLETECESAQGRKDGYSKKVAELTPKQEEAAKILASAENALKEKGRQLQNATNESAKIEKEVELDATIARLDEEQEKRAEQLQEVEKYKTDADVFTELGQALPTFKSILAEFAKSHLVLSQVEKQEQEFAKRDEQIRMKQTEIEQKEAELKKLANEAQGVREQGEELKSGKQRAEALLKNREQAHGKAECPTCGTSLQGTNLNRFHKELKELGNTVQTLDGQLSLLRSRGNNLEKQLERDSKKLDKLKEENREEAIDLKHDRKNFKSQVEDAKGNERNARSEWRELLQGIQFSQALFTEPTQTCYDAASAQRKTLKRSSDKYQELKQVQSDWNAVSKQIKQLERTRKYPAGSFSQADLANAQKEEKRLETRVAEDETALKSLRSTERKLNDDLRDANSKLASAQTDLRRIEGTDLPAAKKRDSDAQDEATRARQQLDEIQGALAWDAEAQLFLQRAIEGNAKSEASLKARIATARPLAAELAVLETAEQAITKRRAQRETLLEQLDSYPQKIQHETLEVVTKKIERKNQEYNNLENERGKLAQAVGDLKRQLKEKEKKQKAHAEAAQEFAGLRHLESLLAPQHKGMPEGGLLRQYILRGTLCQIADTASRILDDWGQAIDVIVPANHLAFRMIDRTSSNAERHFRLFSGGEKFMVALATALAIGEFSSQTGRPECLFIDEGFGLLDTENRARVAREIVSGLLASGRRKQVVVITHMDDVQAAFSSRYHLVHNGSFTQLHDGGADGLA